MRKSSLIRLTGVLLLATLATVLQTGCATRTAAPQLFDFGPLPSATAARINLPPLTLAEVRSPPWQDGPLMFYRLGYANAQQPHPYAASRWSMSVAQLFGQRLKNRIGQAGGTVLQQGDVGSNGPLLTIDSDEFIHYFTSPAQSEGRLSLRASLLQGQQLLGQRQFVRQGGGQQC